MGVVHRRRSLVEVKALVAEFEASGLMRAAFCQQRGLAVGTLDKYRQRAHDGDLPPFSQPLITGVSHWFGWLWLAKGAGRDGALVVELRSGRRIEVCRGFDAGTLERLLSILDRV